jgi:DNA-binding HxlR family transcriptional regulator
VSRGYDDPCGLARALGAVGERWALLVVRELRFGPKRFTDLSRGLPAMSQNVLAQRLRELEQAGVVRRRALGPPASTRAYDLTPYGRELQPALLALARWGSRLPLAGPADGALSVDALMLALETTFDPAAAGTLTARVELRIGADRFRARIEDGRFDITRGVEDITRGFDLTSGVEERPDIVIETADVATLRALVFGGRPLTGEVPDGDPEIAARFLNCFPRPAAI